MGLSGQTEFPHLHMTLRHAGKVVDPFAPNAAPGACTAQGSMWRPAAARALDYKAGVVMNSGFAGAPVSDGDIEAGGIAPPDAGSAALVAYMRVIGADKGDEFEIILRGPDGAVLVTHRQAPLDRDKAQYFAMAGKKRPANGWPKGRYVAELKVWRGGKPVMRKTVEVVL